MNARLSAAEEALLAHVDPQEVAVFLQSLIRARSDFPPGDTTAVIEAVAAKLQEAAIPSRRVTRSAGKVNLIGEFPGPDQGAVLLYHAHADTVGAGDPQAWESDPFAGEARDGFLYGRGAGDDKGSVAAQVMALVCLARAGARLNGRLQIAVVADEESGGLDGTKWLHDTKELEPDFLVVGEQTNNHVAIAERVACGIDLTIYGKSAHGATPWEGENAVLHMAQALSWLQARLFPRLRQRSHPFLPSPTLNVGRIEGGVQWNIVPDRCTAAMDRRLLPGETREGAMAEIAASLDEYGAFAAPLTYELTSEGEVAANINTPVTSPFVRAAAAALQAVSGERRDLEGYMQTSDGRWFAADGIPILIFGPGDPASAHAANERVALDQLVEATRFLALFAWRWLQQEE